jgi:hypothetical protein
MKPLPVSGEKQFWYNTKTMQVEEGPQSLAIYRIGPFETKEEAAAGLRLVLDRAERLLAEDDENWSN